MYRPLRPYPGHHAKEQVIDDVPMRIGSLKFGVFSTQEIQKQSHIEVSDPRLYNYLPDRIPAVNGPLDKRLGNACKTEECQTCGLYQRACNGHWGYIRLNAPCFHVGFLSFTIDILNQVCKTCSRILLDEADRRKFSKSLSRPGLDDYQRKLLLKRVQLECKKRYVCPHCSASNGPVRKVPGNACKLVHLRFEHYFKSTAKKKSEPGDKRKFDTAFRTALTENSDLERHLRRIVDELLAVKVYDIFSRIPQSDCRLLGVNPKEGRPESYLWTYLPVPPVTIRPSVPGDQGSTEDDLTAKLGEIVDVNTRLKSAMENGEYMGAWMDHYEKLQDYLAMYINSHAPGLNKTEYGKAIRSFCTRLKGKQGRFRGNLSGKRVNYSARTVIGPDPNLSVEEVGIPVHVAKILTYPERVNRYNIDELRKRIRNGPQNYPGANLVHKKDARSVVLQVVHARHTILGQVIDNLQFGDIVYRHLTDGDIVLFNRQPSLHKLSILCHRVRVHPGRTFRLNESICTPYNADFDGDEMNIHVPQTEEARTEALELMGVKHNIVTPKNGAPIVAPIQDFITCAYLLSGKDRFFTRSEFSQLMGYMFDATGYKDPESQRYMSYELPPPTILKPMFLWTGKQIFSTIMRPNKASKVLINAEAPCRQYKGELGVPPDLSANDAYFVVRNSEVMCGVLDKSIIGEGKKCSIFYAMLRDYGEDYAVAGMNRLARLSARWLGTQGFSIGIGDVYPSHELALKKKALMAAAMAKSQELIGKFSHNLLPHDPGCDEEQTLENKLSGILGAVRRDAGDACFEELSGFNAAVIMAKCGSKGSNMNVSQMVAGVGQQVIGGKRVENGFQDRTTPHFRKGARDPASKGFVEDSFFSGLNPTEFIFHAMSGREGLVDTAVKTAETGYMSRRLIKSLEDASIAYDKTVRSSNGGIIEFAFGDDSHDPAELEGEHVPVDLERTWRHALEATHEPDAAGMTPDKVRSYAKERLEAGRKLLEISLYAGAHIDDQVAGHRFLEDLYAHIDAKADHLENLRKQYHLRKGTAKARSLAIDRILTVTQRSLDEFLNQCITKYVKSTVQAGHAVGAIAAQSIGEPGTQMTLKTFHFAGLGGMHVTEGVPRIKEIINAAKYINTPIITCELENKTSEQAAQIVKGRIEKIYLRDIAAYIEDVWSSERGYIRLRIDFVRIAKLQLDITMSDIEQAIIRSKGLRIKRPNIASYGNHIRITPDVPIEIHSMVNGVIDHDDYSAKLKSRASSRRSAKIVPSYFILIQEIMRDLLSVVVKGCPETNRAIIKRSDQKNAAGQEELQLLVEGYGLKQCMSTPGVHPYTTRTNSVIETLQTLGIEAARSTITSEMQSVMRSMDIAPHHIQLLADTMTQRGEVLGITRFGMAKCKDSVLQLASFEKTPDHLFEAGARMKEDRIEGVSESIIMGQPVRLGTGLAQVFRPLCLTEEDLRRKEPVFQTAWEEDRVAEVWGEGKGEDTEMVDAVS